MLQSQARSNPVLTVITPVRNAEQTLPDTLRSVSQLALRLQDALPRTQQCLQYIVVDGASTDQTLPLIQAFCQQQLACELITDCGGGPYAAMNAGLAAACGHFVHILNADDYIVDPGAYVALLLEGLSSGASILLGSIVYFRRPSFQVTRRWEVRQPPVDRALWKRQIETGLHYPHPGFIAKTALVRREQFDVRYGLSADYKLMQTLLLQRWSDSVCVSSAPIVAMAEGGSTSGWRPVIQGARQIRAINRELGLAAPLWRRYLEKARQLRGLNVVYNKPVQ